jgi:hypothetical protein
MQGGKKDTMNANLLNVIKQITAQYGDSILSEPKRVSAFLADLARDEPKPHKTALVRCLEHGFAQTLKNIPENERANCKQKLAQKLHDEEGLDLSLCGETLELLAAVLFSEEQKPKKNLCKNCGKELQEEWKACPFCSTAVESHEVPAPMPEVPVPAVSAAPVPAAPPISAPVSVPSDSTNTVDKTAGCTGCRELQKHNCNYYGCDISEAAGYDCGMKMNDPDAKKLRNKKATANIILGIIAIANGIWFFGFGDTYPTGIAIGILCFLGLYFIVGKFNQKKRRENAQRRSS